MGVPKIVDTGINVPDAASAFIRLRNLRQCVERHAHHSVFGRRFKQGAELPFGNLQSRAHHIVNQADMNAIRVPFPECGGSDRHSFIPPDWTRSYNSVFKRTNASNSRWLK